MLAGLIRDEERTVLAGVPGLSDMPLIGRLFARNRKESTQTDIILTLTPHIVRVLDLTEADLRPFRLGRERPSDGGADAGRAPRHPAAAARPADRRREHRRRRLRRRRRRSRSRCSRRFRRVPARRAGDAAEEAGRRRQDR